MLVAAVTTSDDGERLRPTVSAEPPVHRTADLLRAERVMVLVRWVAVFWGAAQVALYDAVPYPAGVQEVAYGLIGLLAAANVAIWFLLRGASDLPGARRVASAGLALEIVTASALVWLYAFDQISAMWAILFLIPAAGAVRFHLVGALGAWAVAAGSYVAREFWAASRYGAELSTVSITFRMGLLLLVALIVGLLARDLVRERARIRALEQWRGRLVAMLAHDIRSPLSAIDVSLASMRPGLPEQTRVELVEVARRQVARLLALTEDLLTLASAERDHLTVSPQRVPLREIVDRALSYTDAGGRVEVDVDDGLMVDADPARLEQVIVNLVTNALRHGRPPVRLSAAEADEGVCVEVSDHGDGVPEGVISTLFEPFSRTDTDGSVGLGLWVVHELVSAHGGGVTYDGEEGRGARFRVDLPAVSVPADAPIEVGTDF
jgi:signal transduction histidine kinase